MFILIGKWTLILKVVGKEVFLLKPKLQNQSSQRREHVNGAKSQKEKRLLCESVFV